MSALAPEVPAGPPLSHAAAPRGLSLRWRLILLVVASIVPLLAFSLFLQFWAFRDNVASVGNRALANAHNMSVAVGRELEGCIRGLEVMAAAPELQAETLDISALREHASALAARFAGSSVTL